METISRNGGITLYVSIQMKVLSELGHETRLCTSLCYRYHPERSYKMVIKTHRAIFREGVMT